MKAPGGGEALIGIFAKLVTAAFTCKASERNCPAISRAGDTTTARSVTTAGTSLRTVQQFALTFGNATKCSAQHA